MCIRDRPITNYGEQMLVGYTDEGVELNMKFNLAAVSKPLGSVRKICAAGNQVVFGVDEANIITPDGKTKIPVQKSGGTYSLSVWVQVPDVPGQVYGLEGSRFRVLDEEEEDDEHLVFQRRI